ncbi:MAG: hypothetical protein KAV18_03095 [Candidatus Omnitrophica bacterium]|nr:hypothetical protein [Candidatus Omnitrophota bacterium]
MVKKEITPEVKKAIDELFEKQKQDLYEIFAEETFDLTFDEREKLIDSKIDKARCEILEKHIAQDPDGVFKNKGIPDELAECLCGNSAILSRDERTGDIKIYEREIKTKRGAIKVKEHGYFCCKCRKIFFPSEG